MFEVNGYDTDGSQIYYFTQWDLNRKLILYLPDYDLSIVPEVHFCNKKSTEALVVQSSIYNNKEKAIIVDVPNILLQESYPLSAYVYLDTGEDDCRKTVLSTTIIVNQRTKPSEYIYVENIDFNTTVLEERIYNRLLANLGNLSVESDVFLINVNYDETTSSNYVSDKTFAEISEAKSNGKYCVLMYFGVDYELQQQTNGTKHEFVKTVISDGEIVKSIFVINNNNEVTFSEETITLSSSSESSNPVVELDTTLSVAGKAADAKAVGDKVTELRNLINSNQQTGGGDTIPDYVVTEACRVVADVSNVQSDRTVNIAGLSDWHLYTDTVSGNNEASNNWTSTTHAIQGLELVSRYINLNATICLGDYTVGDTLHDASGWLDILRIFNDKLSNIKVKNLFKTYGNHDNGYGGVYISKKSNYPYIASYNDDMELGSVIRGYGYKDLSNLKLRIIVLNTSEYTSSEDLTSFVVTDGQYRWFARALDLSGKDKPEEWQTLIFSHHPLDWSSSGSTSTQFSTILSAYENGGSITIKNDTINYEGKNSAVIIGNIHGHLHNMNKGIIAGTNIYRWCNPNASYDRNNNTYSAWLEGESYNKTVGTAQDTAFMIYSINLDTGVLNRIHYGAGYSDSTTYIGTGEDPEIPENPDVPGGGTGGEDSGDTNVESVVGYRLNSSGKIVKADTNNISISEFIPASYGNYITATNIGWDGVAQDPAYYIAFYSSDSEDDCLVAINEGYWLGADYNADCIVDGGFKNVKIFDQWKGSGNEDRLVNTAYVRISGTTPADDSKFNIAVTTEPIE